MKPTSPQSSEPNTPHPTTQAETTYLPLDPWIFKAALPRGSHALNFAASAVVTYLKSNGLSGLEPTLFSALHDISSKLSAKLIPLLVYDLAQAGIVPERPAAPFGAYAGYAPTPAFLAAVRTRPELLHPLSPHDAEYVAKIPDALIDASDVALEERWIDALARAFECVHPGAPLAVPHFSRFLPDFDGKSARVDRIISALHEQELVTLTRSEGSSELHMHPGFVERIRDRDLAARLADPSRESKVFPWTKPTVDISQIRSAEATATPTKSTTPAATPQRLKFPKLQSSNTEPKGHAASRELRKRILEAMPECKPISPGEIVKLFPDTGLTPEALRYHIKMLAEAGEITHSGHGRGVKIMRPRQKSS